MNGSTQDHAARDPAAGGTARWIAASRARETSRPDRLFDDPWASELAEADGFAMLEDREPDGTPNVYLPIRTRFFDDLVARHSERTRHVVLLGAGHDTRVLRLTFPEHVTVFAVDQAEVLAATGRVIERVRAERPGGPGWVPVAADLRDSSWEEALLDAGFDRQASCLWVAEGLFYYLTGTQVHDLLVAAAHLSHAKTLFAADVFGTGLLGLPSMRNDIESRRTAGLRLPFCTDDPAGLLNGAGWSVDQIVEPGQAAANYGRLPVLPDSWDGGPHPTMRTYLVVGVRPPDPASPRLRSTSAPGPGA